MLWGHLSGRISFVATLLAPILATGCTGSEESVVQAETNGRARLVVYVVNYPLEYFARRIGGESVEVFLPAPRDVDPAFWKPSAAVVAAYQSADLIVENGAGYAGWLRTATLPRATRVDTSEGFVDRLIAEASAVTHGHGPAGAHTHAGTAFTTWLDPTLAILHARAVAEAFIERRPDASVGFRDRLAELEQDLLALDARLAAALAPLAGERVLFSRPVYQYLARRYGLAGSALHWEPEEVPPRSEWDHLAARLTAVPARVILFEGPPDPETKRRLEALGVRSLVFETCAHRRDGSDWLARMHENAQRIEDHHEIAASPVRRRSP